MIHFLFSLLDLNQHHDHLHHHHNHLDPHNDQAKNAKQKSAHSTHELRGDNELIYKMWVDGEPQIDSDQDGDVDCEGGGGVGGEKVEGALRGGAGGVGGGGGRQKLSPHSHNLPCGPRRVRVVFLSTIS